MTTLALDRALARQSCDALAATFVRRYKPVSPDKKRTARSFAAEIRRLVAGKTTWFQRRPAAARLLANILGSTPKKLGLVPYEIQSLEARIPVGWRTHGTRTTIEAAEDLAWTLLVRHGGQWRVRHGHQIIASGAGYRLGEHNRTATWRHAQAEDSARKETTMKQSSRRAM